MKTLAGILFLALIWVTMNWLSLLFANQRELRQVLNLLTIINNKLDVLLSATSTVSKAQLTQLHQETAVLLGKATTLKQSVEQQEGKK